MFSSSSASLHMFLSYASEDGEIASALAQTLRAAFGDKVEITMMSEFQSGLRWRGIIDDSIGKTDVMIAIATGQLKRQHSFTGYEIGSFTQSMRNKPEMEHFANVQRRMIPFAILDRTPDTISDFEGIDIRAEELRDIKFDAKNLAEEIEQLEENDKDSGVKSLSKLLFDIDDIISAAFKTPSKGLQEISERKSRLENLAKELLANIFKSISNRVRETDIPKSRILIRVPPRNGQDLSDMSSVTVLPEGPCQAAFGRVNLGIEQSWETFTKNAVSKDVTYAWSQAFLSLVNRVDDTGFVDNSIIISFDKTKLYRLFTSKVTTYYSEAQEFQISIVELLRRKDHGDPYTTVLLKALQVSLGYRFMFLEETSEYSETRMLVTPLDKFKQKISDMTNSLDLLLQTAEEANLADDGIVQRILGREVAPNVDQMHKEWLASKDELYTAARYVLQQDVAQLSKTTFIQALSNFRKNTLPTNKFYTRKVMEELQRIIAQSSPDS